MKPQHIKIALVDDHILIREGIKMLINTIDGFEVIIECSNGKELVDKVSDLKTLPDVVLLDIRMPIMDGYDTAQWLTDNYPQILVIALSTMDDESSIIKMIQKGSRGYVLKNADTTELQKAICSVIENGFYYNELVSQKVMKSLGGVMSGNSPIATFINLSDKEKEFLKWVCTEKSYAEIAKEMFVSPRTIDGYRDMLFEKLDVKSRVGLVLYSIKHGLVQL